MKRMIITIPDEDKSWLESYSHSYHQSVSETIRKAIKSYKEKRIKTNRKEFLAKTAGIWKEKNIDGLEYVNNIRNEWNR